MPSLALAILAALAGSFVVRSAFALRKNLKELTPAELDVKMSECKGCRATQKQAGMLPRQLIRLPVEVTQTPLFQNRGMPVLLCEYCDSFELEGALQAHQKRIDNK